MDERQEGELGLALIASKRAQSSFHPKNQERWSIRDDTCLLEMVEGRLRCLRDRVSPKCAELWVFDCTSWRPPQHGREQEMQQIDRRVRGEPSEVFQDH